MTVKQPLKRWLRRNADNPRRNLLLFITGFCLFFFGVLVIAVAEFLLQSPLARESVALVGLFIGATGVMLAAFGYICLSVLRILRFLSDDNDE